MIVKCYQYSLFNTNFIINFLFDEINKCFTIVSSIFKVYVYNDVNQ